MSMPLTMNLAFKKRPACPRDQIQFFPNTINMKPREKV